MTTTTFQTENLDESLSLEELSAIHGAGVWSWLKEKAQQVGDYIEETFGDGDGKHEWKDDYEDEFSTILCKIMGCDERDERPTFPGS